MAMSEPEPYKYGILPPSGRLIQNGSKIGHTPPPPKLGIPGDVRDFGEVHRQQTLVKIVVAPIVVFVPLGVFWKDFPEGTLNGFLDLLFPRQVGWGGEKTAVVAFVTVPLLQADEDASVVKLLTHTRLCVRSANTSSSSTPWPTLGVVLFGLPCCRNRLSVSITGQTQAASPIP